MMISRVRRVTSEMYDGVTIHPMVSAAALIREADVQQARVKAPALTPAGARVVSLDVFRGLTMILLISHAFGLLEALKDKPGFLASQFDHAQWVGCTLWDLIQPAFTFIVGAAMPFSVRRRLQEGQSKVQVFRHVVWRAALLIFLSNVLSNWTRPGPPRLQLINVLCQIAFGYVVCYLIMNLRFRLQVIAGVSVMILHQALFFAFPGPQGPFDPTGNIGAVLDRQLLGYNYSGSYTTLNFLGNAITILFGVWTGMLFSSVSDHGKRLRILFACAISAFVSGLLLSMWMPMVKRLWTASFTLYSTGWVLLGLIALYWVVEMRGWKRWAFPAIVVGTNCIFIYSFSQVLRGWLSRGIGNFTGHFWFLGAWGEIPHNLLVLATMWYLCFWLYQRRIFFRI
jgi:heparan-alpha-glucosaminide N-acetyltransferase